MRWRKRWFLAIPLVALLLCLAGLLIFWGPASRMAERMTLQQLEAAYGGRVTVGDIRLRWRGIELRDVELWEETERDELPRSWLTARQVHIHLPLWRGLDDPPPIDHIEVRGVRARVPLDADGQLLLNLPLSDEPGIPEIPTDRIVVEDVEVEVRLADSPPIFVRDLAFLMYRPIDNWEVTGTIGDLLKSSWTFSGEVDSTFQQAEARIACEQLSWNWQQILEMELLPDVDGMEWDRVRAEGTLALDWQLRWSDSAPLDHGGTIKLGATSMELRDVDVPIHVPSGTITAADNQWRLSEMVIELLEGSVELSGRLDWPVELPDTPRLVLQGNARRMNIAQIPWESLEGTRELGAFPELGGELGGQANGRFLLEAMFSSVVGISGESSVTISEPQWQRLTLDPIDIRLQLEQWRYDPADSDWQPPQGTLGLNVSARDVPWEELVVQLSEFPDVLDIPEELRELRGMVGGEVRATLPLESLTEYSTHEWEGNFQLSSLQWRSIAWSEIQGDWSWRDGLGRLEQLAGLGPDGERLSGQGQLPSAPDEEFFLRLLLEDLAIESISGPIGELVPESYTGRQGQWQDLASWRAGGSIRLDQLTAFDETLHEPLVRWEYENRKLELLALSARWQDASLEGSGEVLLEAPYSFLLRMDLPEIDAPQLLAAFDVASPLEWRGTVAGSGHLQGELESGRWQLIGEGALRDVVGGEFVFDEIPFSLQVDPSEGRFRVPDVSFASGSLALTTRLPFEGDWVSEVQIEMRDLESAQLASLLPDLPEIPRGRVSGTVTATGWERPAQATLRGTWTTPRWEVGLLQVEQGVVQLELADERLEFEAMGNLLGGRVQLVGGTPWDPVAEKPWESLELSADVTVDDVRLERAIRQLGRDAEALRDLRGVATGVGRITWMSGQGIPQIAGRGELREIRWGRDELLQSAEAEFTVSESAWQLRNISARVGQGTVSGQANGPLAASGSGAFQLTASRLDLRRLMAPWPDLASEVEGTLDARIRGQLDSVWRGTAEMGISRGRLAGVDLGRFRLPIDWSFSPARSRVSLTLRETALRIAQGRAVVRGELDWDRELSFRGNSRLVSLDLRRLLRGMVSASSVPSGRLNGQLEFSGNRVRSMRDVRGSFEGTLGDAQALRLPVMSALTPALGGGQVASSVFEDSDIRLSLARGRVEVERLALVSSAVQILATGHVTLEGRLALDVTANLGQINTQTPLARALRTSLLVSAPTIQIALLARANEWLTNRLLFLRVVGTTRSPTVQLRPGATVGREAIQFFLEEATGVSGLTPRGN